MSQAADGTDDWVYDEDADYMDNETYYGAYASPNATYDPYDYGEDNDLSSTSASSSATAALAGSSNWSNASLQPPAATPEQINPFIEFKIAQYLWVYVGSTIIAVGTLGHVMAVIVLLGSKRMRLLSLTVYLVAASVAGLAALYVGLLRQVVLHESGWTVDVRDLTSDAGCRAHAALTYLTLQLYLWLQATIAVERAIAVWRPLHYKRWCTWRRNLIIVASIVLLLALFNSIVGFVYHVDPYGYCVESPDQRDLFQIVWGHVDLVLYSVFPVSIMVPCNAITLFSVYRSRVDCGRVGGRRSSTPEAGTSGFASGSGGSSAGRAASSRRYAQLSVMLVAHNCVCVATTLPISVIFLVPWPTERYSAANARRELEWTVCSLLQYLGTTFSFVIYSTSAQRFRRAIVDLFSRGFNASKTTSTAAGASTSSRKSSSSGGGGGRRASRSRRQMSLVRTDSTGARVYADHGQNGSVAGGGSYGIGGAQEHEHTC